MGYLTSIVDALTPGGIIGDAIDRRNNAFRGSWSTNMFTNPTQWSEDLIAGTDPGYEGLRILFGEGAANDYASGLTRSGQAWTLYQGITGLLGGMGGSGTTGAGSAGSAGSVSSGATSSVGGSMASGGGAYGTPNGGGMGGGSGNQMMDMLGGSSYGYETSSSWDLPGNYQNLQALSDAALAALGVIRNPDGTYTQGDPFAPGSVLNKQIADIFRVGAEQAMPEITGTSMARGARPGSSSFQNFATNDLMARLTGEAMQAFQAQQTIANQVAAALAEATRRRGSQGQQQTGSGMGSILSGTGLGSTGGGINLGGLLGL